MTTSIKTNSYFTPDIADDTERNMVSDLIAEAIEISGIPSYYLPFSELSVDLILDEVVNMSYTNGYEIPVYVSSFVEQDGQTDLMTKFGISYNDDYGFMFSRQHFSSLAIPERNGVPLAGDLIYIPLLETLYVINEIPHRNKMSQLGQQFVWLLKTSPYSPSMDDISTDDFDINNIGDSVVNFEEARENNQNYTSADEGDLITINTDDPFGDY